MSTHELFILISDLLLTVLIYVFPFWLFRSLRPKPVNTKLSLFIVAFYYIFVHTLLMYIIYGESVYPTMLPYLWMFVSEYFLIAKNPKFVPKIMNYSETETKEKEEKIEIKLVDEYKPHQEQQTPKKKFFRSNREKLLVGFIVSLLIGYSILGYYFYSYSQTMEQENASLQRKLNDYTEVMERRADYGALKEKSDFIDAYVVFVGEDQYYYHTYDCLTNLSSFWAYNINAAVGQGYHPCPTCKPPISD